jgi:hypothetical protein
MAAGNMLSCQAATVHGLERHFCQIDLDGKAIFGTLLKIWARLANAAPWCRQGEIRGNLKNRHLM